MTILDELSTRGRIDRLGFWLRHMLVLPVALALTIATPARPPHPPITLKRPIIRGKLEPTWTTKQTEPCSWNMNWPSPVPWLHW